MKESSARRGNLGSATQRRNGVHVNCGNARAYLITALASPNVCCCCSGSTSTGESTHLCWRIRYHLIV